MNQDERNRLTEIAAPEGKGRLSERRLMAQAILEHQDKLTEIEQALVTLVKGEMSQLKLMQDFMKQVESKLKSQKGESDGNV